MTTNESRQEPFHNGGPAFVIYSDELAVKSLALRECRRETVDLSTVSDGTNLMEALDRVFGLPIPLKVMDSLVDWWSDTQYIGTWPCQVWEIEGLEAALDRVERAAVFVSSLADVGALLDQQKIRLIVLAFVRDDRTARRISDLIQEAARAWAAGAEKYDFPTTRSMMFLDLRS